MATKKARPKSLTAQLKEANEKIETLERNYKYAQQRAENEQNIRTKYQTAVEEIHNAIDNIPGAPAKFNVQKDQYGSETKIENSVAGRLFGWLANTTVRASNV